MSQQPGEVWSQESRQGTQRDYETVMILAPSTNKTGIGQLITRVRGVLENGGGRLQNVDNWGLRTLAYPIGQNKKGVYLYTRFLGGSGTVQELERNLRIYDEVIRYLTVKVDEDVDPDARPSDLSDEVLEAATDAGEDPVEVARREAEAEAARRAEEEAAARAAEEAAAGDEAQPAEAPAPTADGGDEQ
jgi:small subunit ribosomal protein S6